MITIKRLAVAALSVTIIAASVPHVSVFAAQTGNDTAGEQSLLQEEEINSERLETKGECGA